MEYKVILYVICFSVIGKPSVLFLIRARYQLLLRRHSLGAGRHPPLDAAVQLNVWSTRRSRPSARSFSDVALDADIELRTLKNWARWESEKPEWFDENFKASVPDEFIPDLSLEELKKKSGGSRRRSSVFGAPAAGTSVT